jgi:hypothetical protein
MQMNKFEEKAKEFIVSSEILPADFKGSMFHVVVDSVYKSKKLVFQSKNIAFEVSAENLEDLFDKAFRVLKSYGPKATRERNKEEDTPTPATTEGQGEE